MSIFEQLLPVYERLKVRKPHFSRARSREVYIVATGRKP